MVNEEEEETYYHGTQLHYDDKFTHGLEGEVGHTPMGKNVDPSTDVSRHHKKTVTPIVRLQRTWGASLYQQTSFTVMESIPKLKKIIKPRKKVVDCPEKTNEDIVNENISNISKHILLDSLYAASTLGF
ncbi:unnamed protein product [Lactuca saligna]|uniref:Uncharacterized protein n=1 Tax=Lactuca saligna TaxID=75948 RepID=A0AA35YXU5_LACSI|nr:unnamed protein product [Lactuca saligna]